MSNPKQCPLCEGALEKPPVRGMDDLSVSCPRCGDFVLWLDMIHALDDREIRDRHILSGYTRERNEHGNKRVVLHAKDVENIRNQAPQGVQEKADRLLISLARRSPWPGFEVTIAVGGDYPLAYCSNEEELNYFIQFLSDEQWIKHRATNRGRYCQLTPSGWSRVESLKKSNRESLKVFVAMSFHADLTPAFTDGIKPGVEACGYRPLRIDNKEFLGGIFDEIIGEIRESRFVVADLTRQRQGVYYEAGFALGLGLPVLLTCRDDDLKNVHFDAKHVNILVWKTPADLATPLKNRIRAVIGLAPELKV